MVASCCVNSVVMRVNSQNVLHSESGGCHSKVRTLIYFLANILLLNLGASDLPIPQQYINITQLLSSSDMYSVRTTVQMDRD